MHRFLLLVLSFFVFIYSASGFDKSMSGLAFFGNDVRISERTSYDVFSTMQPFPKDSLTISFEISLQETYSIGHILTCKSNSGEVFNLIVSQNDRTDSLYFNFNHMGGKIVLPIGKCFKVRGGVA